MGDSTDDGNQPTAGSIGAPEGAPAATPSSDEIAELYKATGVKAPVPTDKAKGRPKANGSGAKADSKQDDESGSSGQGKNGDDDGSDKSKTSSASSKNGSDGGAADSKGSKNGASDGKDGDTDSKVSKDGSDDEEGVRKNESRNNGDASKRGEEDDDQGNGRDGKDGGESGDSEEEGKRPGKSNPEVEKRMQRLAADRKEALERAQKLEQELAQERRAKEQAKIQQEDPEYTIDDFRKVRDREGNIHDLTPEQAELYWRRWKEGYEQRAAERDAKETRSAAQQAQAEEQTRQLMKTSVEAYDSLAAMMDEYPELVSTSGKFDKDFAADAMPIIAESVEYLAGTEPGNAEGNLPVIVGLKVDPRKILDALKRNSERKRTLPLNGVRDNVDSGSNVSVSHSRSSDPVVNQANDLYKDLGIKKRI